MNSVASWILVKCILIQDVTTVVKSEVKFKVQAKQHAERHQIGHGHLVHDRDIIPNGRTHSPCADSRETWR